MFNYFTAERNKGGVSQEVRMERQRNDGYKVSFEASSLGEIGKTTSLTQNLEFEAEIDTGNIKEETLQESASFQFPS